MLLATHNGNFHADDLLSAAFLLTVLPDVKFLRTRDPAQLAQAHTVFDVGGIYDLTTRRFDHHFKDSPRRANGVPYSSFGLLWAAYKQIPTPRWQWLDDNFVSHIDRIDTGHADAGVDRAISAALFDINPTWQETAGLDAAAFDLEVGRRFHQTLTWLQPLLLQLILARDSSVALGDFHRQVLEHTAPYTAAVQASLVHASARLTAAVAQSGSQPYLRLDNAAYPWPTLLPAMPAAEKLLYVVYPTPGNTWRCQGVPTVADGFTPRRPFPENWRGKSAPELQQITGIAGMEFCHPAGFLLGAKTASDIDAVLRQLGVTPGLGRAAPGVDLA